MRRPSEFTIICLRCLKLGNQIVNLINNKKLARLPSPAAPPCRKTRMFAAAVVLVVAASTYRHAQAAVDDDTDRGDKPGIEEIFVTAQFRETLLQLTPVSITAVTADMIEAKGITDIPEIAAAAPNISLRRANAAFGDTLQAYIRGIGQYDYNYAFEPGVGIYIDDVYHATAFGSVVELFDLERVEVLRGPQGTLFGKNSIGGAIRMISRKPEGDRSGHIEFAYGRFNSVLLRGAYDMPLIQDVLALRLSVLSDSKDGYQDLIDFRCDRPELAGSIPSFDSRTPKSNCKVGSYGGKNVQGVRGQLRWRPAERWDVNLSFDYVDDDSEAAANKLLAIGDGASFNTEPDTITGLPPLIAFLWNPNENIPNFSVPFDARFLDPHPYRTYGTYKDPLRGIDTTRKSLVESWGVSATVDFQIADDFAFKSITAYREYDGEFGHDPDQSPLAAQSIHNFLGNEQFSQEFRFSGSGLQNRLFYTLGAFYMDSESTLRGLVLLPIIPGAYQGALGFMQDDLIKTKNKSAFVDATFDLIEGVQIFGGLRYTDENKKYFFDHTPSLTITDPGGKPFDRTDYRLGLRWRATDQVMLYLSTSTGFRTGGVNPRPFSDSQFIPYGPEEVTSYEFGAKLDLADQRVTLNTAVFYTDFDARIQTQQTIDADGNPLTAPTNLGTGKIKGFEVELEARPVENLRINAQAGHAKFSSSDEAFVGERVIGTPDWTANAGIQYDIPLGAVGMLSPRLDYTYQSRIDYANDNDPVAATGARGLFNASLSWRGESGWRVALHVFNLADKRYYVQKFTLLPFGLGTLEGQPGAPREWRISLRREF